ncbi:MAG TPA: hypothetical protein VGN32_01990 [Ktedonobacterales bacterium]|jgi:uncharacterized membrane protein|nr:hypothetical protein [Ktedonobacterales bacterium]
MERLRGRNLSHIGCTLGLIVGLFLGLVLALVVSQVLPSVNVMFAVFGVVTVGLGIAGYFVGNVATRRLWGPVGSGAASDAPGGAASGE